MHTTRLPLLLVLAALAGASFARPGPDTANMLKLAKPPFALAIRPLPACPTPFELTLIREMPEMGWTLAVDKVENQPGRVVLHVTGTRPDGLLPQVITSVSAKVNLGRFKKGSHILEIHYRNGADAPYELVQVALLRGS